MKAKAVAGRDLRMSAAEFDKMMRKALGPGGTAKRTVPSKARRRQVKIKHN